MIADTPYEHYNLEVEYYNEVTQKQEDNQTNILLQNKNIYLNENNEIITDANFYFYLILNTMLNLKIDYYLTSFNIKYNDRDFGSHAKLAGFANDFIKKLAKKLENSLFKIKSPEKRISILEYLTTVFDNNLNDFDDLSDIYAKFHRNKGDYNYWLLMSDKLATTQKIKSCYKRYFPIIANLLYNCISAEKMLASFTKANPNLSDVWKLFIDNTAGKCQSRLFFENEQGYLVSSLRGLAFALNEIDNHKYIDYDFLVKISEIIGCNKREDISAAVYLPFRYNAEAIQELFKKSYYKGGKRGIKAMAGILNTELDAISQRYDIVDSCDTLNKIYLIEIFNSSLYPYMLVSYIGKKDKKSYINELFANYYKNISDIPVISLEKLLHLSFTLCRELLYLHPLSDGTGRVFLFILLPLLLHQQGFWINSMPEYVWDLLRGSIDHIVNRTLPLCSSALEINSKINWQTNMNIIDKIYICCISGDLIEIKKLIKNNYELLERTIPLVNMLPIEVAVLNNNVELIKYLLIHYSKQKLDKIIGGILSFLKENNPPLKKLIDHYYITMLDKSIEEKQDFFLVNN